ncbi:hypothetical protein [Sphaerotilus sp.]|uniref:hypothetical protein n=1 Tax=Sphaerotilus sp. TaxID=2093942 RepID=UPI002ACE6002|nr:hypothetical protein [Sphaerotilus sp.]MDZ7857094.1 hypothetical protein [Sphaerotilus sp.]
MGETVTSPRLQAERDRLYRAEADGRVRALVLALARPADWTALGRVWQGVQTDLGWPAPGISVSGTDACQLWFSLAEPVPAAEAHALLEHLRTRYLADIPPHRVALLPSRDGAHLAPVIPTLQADGEVWSAYIAPDLAPVFAETPWLDIRPGSEGQAELLSRLVSIRAEEYRAALPVAVAVSPVDGSTVGGFTDPRAFLLQVMNDAQVEMALRIEAAKALLHPPAASTR